MLTTILRCAAELPLKAPIYAAIVGLLNSHDPSIGAAIVEAVAEQINGLLRDLAAPLPLAYQDVEEAHRIAVGLRRRLRMLVRFAAELSNSFVLSAPAMLDFLDLFLTTAHDALTVVESGAVSAPADVSKCLRRADFYAALACDSLPWCAASLRSLKPLDFSSQFDSFQRYFDRRDTRPPPALRSLIASDDPAALPLDDDIDANDALRCDRDALIVRWERLLLQQENAWLMGVKQNSVHADLRDKLQAAMSHEISNHIAVPLRESDSAVMYPTAAFEFELMSDADRAPSNLLPLSDVAVVREYVRDVLDSFNADHVGATKFLHAMPLPDGASEDPIVVETLFTEMLALPVAPFPLPFYTAVLGNVCQRPGTSAPKVLGRLALRLWNHAAALDVGVSDRFVRWLALHLSNFDYKWAWTKWAQTMTLPEDDPKRLMVVEVIQACVRLSYTSHITDRLPEQLHAVVPPANVAPVLTYANDDAATLLFDAMQAKETARSVARILARSYGGAGLGDLLDEDGTNADDADAGDAMSAAAELRRLGAFFETLLKAGQQSFSHLLHVIERYEPIAKRLAVVGGAAARRQVVEVAVGLWRQSPQLQVLVLDRLHTYGIIDAIAVVDWAFDPANVSHMKYGHVRDIVRGAVRWSVQAARLAVAAAATATATTDAAASTAELTTVRALNDALYALVERAAAALAVAANDSATTLHFLRGLVLDVVRQNAPHVGAPLRARLDAVDGVEQLGLESAFACGVSV